MILRFIIVKIKKINYLILLFLSILNIAKSQKEQLSSTLLGRYNKGYQAIKNILEANGNFITSVFEAEKSYTDNELLINSSNHNLLLLLGLCKLHFDSKKIDNHYIFRDKENYILNKAIYQALKDTTFLVAGSKYNYFLPFKYSHSDPVGKADITNTFVTKLLATHQGNCRSLTYLYKILADELGAKCWISLAPGHMYIKNYSEKIGWYNTELTSGTFPTDAWIMASSYINPTAVMSGMYMDTLSNQQAIALCVLDLAHLYERQTKNYYDGFILKCCDLVLKYHPVNPMALLLKAETLKKLAIREKSSKYPRLTYTIKEMETTYLKLFELGYREMPIKMKRQKQKEEKLNAKKYK